MHGVEKFLKINKKNQYATFTVPTKELSLTFMKSLC